MKESAFQTGTILDHLVGEDVIADYLLFSLNRLERFRFCDRILSDFLEILQSTSTNIYLFVCLRKQNVQYSNR